MPETQSSNGRTIEHRLYKHCSTDETGKLRGGAYSAFFKLELKLGLNQVQVTMRVPIKGMGQPGAGIDESTQLEVGERGEEERKMLRG